MSDERIITDSVKAGKILQANLANLARKVLAGETLNAYELNLVQQQAVGGDGNAPLYVKNQAELARALGISRRSIVRYAKAEGAPKPRSDSRLNVAEWRAFLEGIIEDKGPTQTALKARQLLLQNEKLQFQIAILKKEYVPAALVEQWGGELGAAVRKVVMQCHMLAPSIVGLSVADAEARLREHEFEILERLHLLDDRIADLKPEVPIESATH